MRLYNHCHATKLQTDIHDGGWLQNLLQVNEKMNLLVLKTVEFHIQVTEVA